ncbi:MAG: ABC transporter permease [Prochloraceae cyanobacterium]|nr:ABC transporter permease [Prochloraceae cyanobacterium]
MIINNITAIFQKELRGYFTSPLAYLVAGFFWLLTGFFFVYLLLGQEGIIAEVSRIERLGQPVNADVAYNFLLSYLGLMSGLIIFIVPILSMNLYAEERQFKTIELLATSPITNWVVAVGKLLGVVCFFTFMMFPVLIYEAIAFSNANPPINLTVPLLAHLGLILLAAAILSLGMFISSLTNSTIFAAIITFIAIVFLWYLDGLGTAISATISPQLGAAISYLSLLKHYDNFIKGIFDTGGIVVFFSYIFLGIFLTANSIEILRFKR